MYTLILICGILLGIILMKIYLHMKIENEISSAKINDIIITRDNKIGILMDYRRNFEYPNVEDDIIYEIKDICTDTIQIVNKSMVYHVVKQDNKDGFSWLYLDE